MEKELIDGIARAIRSWLPRSPIKVKNFGEWYIIYVLNITPFGNHTWEYVVTPNGVRHEESFISHRDTPEETMKALRKSSIETTATSIRMRDERRSRWEKTKDAETCRRLAQFFPGALCGPGDPGDRGIVVVGPAYAVLLSGGNWLVSSGRGAPHYCGPGDVGQWLAGFSRR